MQLALIPKDRLGSIRFEGHRNTMAKDFDSRCSFDRPLSVKNGPRFQANSYQRLPDPPSKIKLLPLFGEIHSGRCEDNSTDTTGRRMENK